MMAVQVYEYDAWQCVEVGPPGASGALRVNVNPRSGVVATVVVSGAEGSVKYGANGTSVMIPLKSIGVEPVSVGARCVGLGRPFVGGALVDVYLSLTGAMDGFSIAGVPVSGHVEAQVLVFRRSENGSVVAVPPVQATTPKGLGGWFVNRRSEDRRPITPTLTGLLVDSSASMRPYRNRVSALKRFTDEVFGALRLPEPKWQDLAVAGVPMDGVGAVHADARPGRWVVVTDLPLTVGSMPAILMCSKDVAEIFSKNSSPSFVPPDEFWAQVYRRDTDFDDSTCLGLDAFGDWMGEHSGSEGVPR